LPWTGIHAEVPVSEQVTGHRRRQTFLTWAGAAVVIMTAVASVAAVPIIAAHRHEQAALIGQRPSGIPAAIPTGTVNLMGLSPVPASKAPGFALTDQDDHRLPLSGFRGKVVVLEFMDSRCTNICPLVSSEFIDAYHDLGSAAGGVVFAAVNVNGHYNQVGDVLAYSRAHQLTTIPDWYFFTGPAGALQAVWRAYDIAVAASSQGTLVHTSAVIFIGPHGTERYVADPVPDRTASGAAYLPPAQISGWGQGIAQVAETMLR
jgi:cytochrome oxidase Cu insertion factor (SCO1/SenC/PrrC family)